MKKTKILLTLCLIAFLSTGCAFGNSKKYEMRKSPCACFESFESIENTIYNG